MVLHNYLQEMFILKERLNKYATLIQRKYKKTQNKEFLETLIPPLFKIIGSFLDCITAENSGVRNKHVHSKRFMDEELSWLSSTIFLAEFDEKFEIESKNAYVIAQKKWYNLIEVNNQELLKLFDVYFNTIYTVITINDKVNLPKSSR